MPYKGWHCASHTPAGVITLHCPLYSVLIRLVHCTRVWLQLKRENFRLAHTFFWSRYIPKKDLFLFLFDYIAQCEKVGRLLRFWLHVQFKLQKKGKFLVVHKQICNQRFVYQKSYQNPFLPDPREAGLHLAFQFSYVRTSARSSVRPSVSEIKFWSLHIH